MPPELLRFGEAADFLRVSRRTLWREIEERKIAFHRIRRRLIFAKEDLTAYLKSRRVVAKDAP